MCERLAQTYIMAFLRMSKILAIITDHPYIGWAEGSILLWVGDNIFVFRKFNYDEITREYLHIHDTIFLKSN